MSEEKTSTRAQARRRAMLEAATELFLEKGFERTSLSDIVDRSKGSRSTLYELFGGKEGLLRAMIEESTTRVWRTARWDDIPVTFAEDELVEMGCRLLRAITAPEAVAVYRIVVSECQRLPEIAALFFAGGPRNFRDEMLRRIRIAQAQGLVADKDPEVMTQVFFGSVTGDYPMRAALGIDIDPPVDMERHVRAGVRLFLNGARRMPS